MTVAMQPRSKFAALPRDDGGDAAAVHAGDTADLERGRREQAAGVAGRNQRVGLAFRDQLGGAGNGGILLLAQRGGRFVIHLDDFAGVDDPHAVVAEAAFGQGTMDFGLVADEEDRGDALVVLQGLLDAGDDNTTPMIAAHDIHCNSHR
jgi:hypothetical protein